MLRLIFRGVEIYRTKGVAGVAIKFGGNTVCIDSLNVNKCNYILYTHNHSAHFPGNVDSFYSPFGGHVVKPNDILNLDPFKISVVDAYNITKLKGGKPIHPKGMGVGYIIDVGGVRIYHTGDTDLIKEITSAIPVDILLLPIGGDSVMTPEEAAEAVMLLRPKIVIPLHYSEKKYYVKFRDIAYPYSNIVLLPEDTE